MKACIVARASSGHQREWGGAFAAGLRRHGWETEITEQAHRADLLVVWGVRRREEITNQRLRGGEVCVLERGYLGDRFRWTSVSFGGGLNGRAEFRGRQDDPARFNDHFRPLLRPWSDRAGYALLIGQVPGDMSLAGAGGDLQGWYRETTAALKARGWAVRYRPHPQAVGRGLPCPIPQGAQPIGGTLQQAFDGAGLVVTFNSNTAVESVLAGVPTIAVDEGSMAWPVTGRALDEVVRPDREAWATALAWKQWTLDEIRTGDCWAHVTEAT